MFQTDCKGIKDVQTAAETNGSVHPTEQRQVRRAFYLNFNLNFYLTHLKKFSNRSSVKTQDSAETINADNTNIQHLDASTCKRHLMVCTDAVNYG